MKTTLTHNRSLKWNLFNRLNSLLLLGFFCLSFSASYAQRQKPASFLSKFGPNAYVGYYAYTPVGYADNPTKKYPLLLFLHGKGEKAFMAKDSSQLSLVRKYGPPLLIDRGTDFPFIVISPQCPFEGWDNVTTDNYASSVYRPGEFVDEILERVKKLYRVDIDRVYLTGLSMGGAATWSYIIEYPEKIAAAIPISSWIDNPTQGCNIASNNVGVWAFQGSKDNAASLVNFIKGVNDCNPAPNDTVRATIYEGLAHTGWDQTYNNTGPGIAPDNIYNWLMRHSKSNLVTNILGESAIQNSFKAYPNPANDILHLSYTPVAEGEVQVQLLDPFGNEVMSKKSTMSSGSNEMLLDLLDIKQGHYFLSVVERGKRKSQKLVVTK